MTTTTPIPTFVPGCTLDVRAGVVGARGFRLLVMERQAGADGTVTAWGRSVRQRGGGAGAAAWGDASLRDPVCGGRQPV